MTLPLDLILYIVIAAVLVIWLKNTLGTRHGEERERPNPFDPARQPPPASPDTKGVKPMPHLDIPDSALRPTPVNAREEALPRNTTSALADHDIAAAQRLDKGFSLPVFARNAQDAYAIILESYADGDLDALTDLTTVSIAQQFKALIAARQGGKLSIEVQGIRACHIAALRLQGAVADIDLEIVAEALMQEYDKDGTLRGGHPDKTTELRDKWTFTRDLGQRDPTWRVSAIHDAVGS